MRPNMLVRTNIDRMGLALAFVLVGCTSSRTVRPLRPLELATAPYHEGAAQARIGSLMYEGGCLLFREDGSAAQLLPVWPSGSVFNGTIVIFHQPAKAEQRIAIGEEFVMEGQPASWSALRPSDFRPFQNQCNRQPFFVSTVRPAN